MSWVRHPQLKSCSNVSVPLQLLRVNSSRIVIWTLNTILAESVENPQLVETQRCHGAMVELSMEPVYHSLYNPDMQGYTILVAFMGRPSSFYPRFSDKGLHQLLEGGGGKPIDRPSFLYSKHSLFTNSLLL